MPALENKVLAFIVFAGAAFILGIVPMQFAHAQGKSNINTLLKTADANAGKQVSRVCSMCHTFDKDGANGVGPNLWNIVGSHRAHEANFSYSSALENMHGKKWTYEALDGYLANPHKFAPGNKMPFSGIKDPKKRADLIAWLRSLSDKPEPLPTAK